MQQFVIGKSTATVDRARHTITFEHADSITGRKANSPWIVPAGVVESVEFVPKSFGVKPNLRLTLRDRSGFNPGIGADMNAIIGSKHDEAAITELRDAIEQLVADAEPADQGPTMRQPYKGAVIAPTGSVKFGDLVLDGRTIYSDGQAAPVDQARAEVVDADAARSRLTATRLAAGALVAGPLGAIVGGLARKSTGRIYVMVTTDDGRVLSGEGPSKEAGKAAEISARINAAR